MVSDRSKSFATTWRSYACALAVLEIASIKSLLWLVANYYWGEIIAFENYNTPYLELLMRMGGRLGTCQEYDPLEPNRRAIKAQVHRLHNPCSRVLDKRAEENGILSAEGERVQAEGRYRPQLAQQNCPCNPMYNEACCTVVGLYIPAIFSGSFLACGAPYCTQN